MSAIRRSAFISLLLFGILIEISEVIEASDDSIVEITAEQSRRNLMLVVNKLSEGLSSNTFIFKQITDLYCGEKKYRNIFTDEFIDRINCVSEGLNDYQKTDVIRCFLQSPERLTDSFIATVVSFTGTNYSEKLGVIEQLARIPSNEITEEFKSMVENAVKGPLSKGEIIRRLISIK